MRKAQTFIGSLVIILAGFCSANAQMPGALTLPAKKSALTVKMTGPEVQFLDSEAEFDIEVYNPGSLPAENVRVTNQMPAGLQFVAANRDGNFDPAARQVIWLLDSLGAGQHRSLTLKLSGTQIGTWTNSAVVTAEGLGDVRAAMPIRIDGVPVVKLRLTVQDDPIAVGTETVYEIHVLNRGIVASTGLKIVATVPEGMEARDVAGPTKGRIQGSEVEFDSLARLSATAEALYRIKVRGLSPGDHRFRVHLYTNELRMPVTAEESTRVYNEQEQ